MRIVITLALFLGACSPAVPLDPTPQPGQDRGLDLVWYSLYGNTRRPPDVLWVQPESLNCVKVNGVYVGFLIGNKPWETGDQCVAGATWLPTPYQSWIAVAMPLHNTAFAHELYHASLWNRGGDGDADHTNPGWQPGAAVDQANKMLKENGL